MKSIGSKKKRKKRSKKASPAKSTVAGSDKVWIGEQDARTLADAEVILGDPKRKREAVKQAKKMAKEKMESAAAMMHVAAKAHVKKPKKANKSKKNEAAFE